MRESVYEATDPPECASVMEMFCGPVRACPPIKWLDWRRVCALAVLAVIASTSQAIELSYGSVDPKAPTADNAIILTGEVLKGDYEVLKKFAAEDRQRFHSRTIVLASQGGDLLEAARIGNFVRKMYMEVFVNPEIGRCASACFLIYVAAVQRDAVPPGLGIHRPYFASDDLKGMPLQEIEGEYRTLLREVRAYLDAQEVPTSLIEKMFSLASSEIYWLTYDDLDLLGMRARWWEQVLLDRCGLNKSLEREYLIFGPTGPRAAEAKRHISDVADCAYQISADERMRNLDELLR